MGLRQRWQGLVKPHPRISAPEQRLNARLFAGFMIVHLCLGVLTLVFADLRWRYLAGASIWDDLDTQLNLAAIVVVLGAFALLRAGYYRAGTVTYIVIATLVAMVGPFMPDPDAEIGLLAAAIIPVLLAATSLRARWVLGLMAAIGGVGALLLLSSSLPAKQAGTGWAVLLIVLIVGFLLILFRDHLRRVETAREAHYRHVFETVTDGIFIADVDGRFLEVNDGASAFNLGTQYQPSASTWPHGIQDGPAAWTTRDGSLWLFGGQSGASLRADLWRFDPTQRQWAWMGGPGGPANAAGVYGTRGVPAAGNYPGARIGPLFFADTRDRLWLFGGDGYDAVGTRGFLNDLWLYHVASRQWVWVSGAQTAEPTGTFGPLGELDASYAPPPREGGAAWADPAGVDGGWIFAGHDAAGTRADLWRLRWPAL